MLEERHLSAQKSPAVDIRTASVDTIVVMTSSISNPLLYGDALLNESIHSSSSDQNDFVGLLLADFSAVLSRGNEPLTENREYMQLTELKFLLKNIRELTAIQLFQSYSRSETVTCTESAESSYSTLRISSAKKIKGSAGRVTGNTDENIEEFRAVGNPSNTKESEESIKSSGVKRASTDRLLLFNNRGKLDAILCDLKKYVSKRLAIAEEHFNSENVRTNMQMDGEEGIAVDVFHVFSLSKQSCYCASLNY